MKIPTDQATDWTPGRPATLAPGVRRIVAPNPGQMTGPGTNTYLVGDATVVILDPGPAIEAHVEAILAAVAGATVAAIAVTHTHGDHSPAAMRLAGRLGVPVVGRLAAHPEFQDPTFRPDIVVEAGTTLETDAGVLIAVPTPGHASNHFCWHQPALRLVYTGDHVLGTVSPVILAPDGDMHEYLASLARLAALDLEAIAPGHGPVLGDPARVLAGLVRHRLAREQRVINALQASGAAPIDRILPVVYADVPSALHRFARYSLEAHLIKLLRDGRVRQDGDHWVLA